MNQIEFLFEQEKKRTDFNNWLWRRPAKDKKGGFFDLPEPKVCNDPDHNFPNMMVIPAGQGYTHVCPKCGYTVTITNPGIRL